MHPVNSYEPIRARSCSVWRYIGEQNEQIFFPDRQKCGLVNFKLITTNGKISTLEGEIKIYVL